MLYSKMKLKMVPRRDWMTTIRTKQRSASSNVNKDGQMQGRVYHVNPDPEGVACLPLDATVELDKLAT